MCKLPLTYCYYGAMIVIDGNLVEYLVQAPNQYSQTRCNELKYVNSLTGPFIHRLLI